MPRIQLFCLPFAGGTAHSYKVFSPFLPEFIQLCPLDLPGHGARLSEPLLTSIEAMVDDLLTQVVDRLCEPYALYGHSLGACLGYIWVRQAIKRGLPLPTALIVSGRTSPSTSLDPEVQTKQYLLSRNDLKQLLKELDGCSADVLENEEVLAFFEPIIRADFQACETFRYEQLPPFDIPITAMMGLGEGLTYADISAWQQETTCRLTIRRFAGRHFFIFESPAQVCHVITQALASVKVRVPDFGVTMLRTA